MNALAPKQLQNDVPTAANSKTITLAEKLTGSWKMLIFAKLMHAFARRCPPFAVYLLSGER